jgi:glucose-6-phosphate isomerase
MDRTALWQRYCRQLCVCGNTGITLDVSRMNLTEARLKALTPAVKRALQAMAALERGAIANPDEKRMVGHYWLRTPGLAPKALLRGQIEETIAAVRRFAAAVHSGKIKPPKAKRFTHLLLIGIGGSALGPQLAASALAEPGKTKMRVYFFDNTDPDGMALVLAEIGSALRETLTLVVSKSGGTKETRNGLLEAQAAYAAAGLNFAAHAAAVTGEGSTLAKIAESSGWRAIFPMWDWVGGRTSELSAVGLLPAALQGIAVDEMLAGAHAMDAVTRTTNVAANPAALMAAAWFAAGNGRGDKAMVVLPYKDRLLLISRYLQQLVMESLGKDHDLRGRIVPQGLTVYGNKGSTDQHAFVQQLRDGRNDFFVNFIEVLRDYSPLTHSTPRCPTEVDPGVGSGAYLHGFLYGTRQALAETGRESLTVTLDVIDAYRLGALIALYERAVGLYAALIGINAYHQPGVEAGKKAAEAVLALRAKAFAAMQSEKGKKLTAEQWAKRIGAADKTEDVYHLLRHAVANADLPKVVLPIKRLRGKTPDRDRFEVPRGSSIRNKNNVHPVGKN